jgi:hypothetical protein
MENDDSGFAVIEQVKVLGISSVLGLTLLS